MTSPQYCLKCQKESGDPYRDFSLWRYCALCLFEHCPHRPKNDPHYALSEIDDEKMSPATERDIQNQFNEERWRAETRGMSVRERTKRRKQYFLDELRDEDEDKEPIKQVENITEKRLGCGAEIGEQCRYIFEICIDCLGYSFAQKITETEQKLYDTQQTQAAMREALIWARRFPHQRALEMNFLTFSGPLTPEDADIIDGLSRIDVVLESSNSGKELLNLREELKKAHARIKELEDALRK